MCHHLLVPVSCMSGINALNATNWQRSTWQNSMSFSSDRIPLTVNTEGQAQMFLGLESPLQATCELKC